MKHLTNKGNKFELVYQEYQPISCSGAMDIIVNNKSIGTSHYMSDINALSDFVDKYYEQQEEETNE